MEHPEMNYRDFVVKDSVTDKDVEFVRCSIEYAKQANKDFESVNSPLRYYEVRLNLRMDDYTLVKP